MDKKEAVSRWESAQFVQTMAATLESFRSGRELFGLDLKGVQWGTGRMPTELGPVGNLARVVCRDSDFSFAVISTSLSNSSFESTRWNETRFLDCIFHKARFSGCDFGGASISAAMDDTVFEECTFAEGRFTAKSLLQQLGGSRTKFVNCTFRDCEFKSVTLRAARFSSCDFQGTRFRDCDMKGSSFEDGAPNEDEFEACALPKLTT